MRAQRGSDVIIVLVGNKTDLAASRVVSAAEIEAHANEQALIAYTPPSMWCCPSLS